MSRANRVVHARATSLYCLYTQSINCSKFYFHLSLTHTHTHRRAQAYTHTRKTLRLQQRLLCARALVCARTHARWFCAKVGCFILEHRGLRTAQQRNDDSDGSSSATRSRFQFRVWSSGGCCVTRVTLTYTYKYPFICIRAY